MQLLALQQRPDNKAATLQLPPTCVYDDTPLAALYGLRGTPLALEGADICITKMAPSCPTVSTLWLLAW